MNSMPRTGAEAHAWPQELAIVADGQGHLEATLFSAAACRDDRPRQIELGNFASHDRPAGPRSSGRAAAPSSAIFQ